MLPSFPALEFGYEQVTCLTFGPINCEARKLSAQKTCTMSVPKRLRTALTTTMTLRHSSMLQISYALSPQFQLYRIVYAHCVYIS